MGSPWFPRGAALRFLGDYELLEKLAEGGMGQVYRARQITVGRELAVKVLPQSSASSPRLIQRFQNEVEAVAKLDHPHILPIYESGEDGGIRFFSMPLAKGGSLAAALRGGKWRRTTGSAERVRQREIAGFMATVAEAVHYAHQRGIIHRDLKPENILLDPEGSPMVSDFGLAKVVGSDANLTQSREILGTWAYMAPEQINGSESATALGDVYGLGVILFELLAGRRPYTAPTLSGIWKQMEEAGPKFPEDCDPKVERDLATICLECLAKEPARRYASAREVSEDLHRYLRHEPILARRASPAEKAWLWCRKRPSVAIAIGLAVLSLLLGLAGTTVQWKKAEARRRQAEISLYVADTTVAQDAYDEGNLGYARQLLRAHVPEPGGEDLRGMEWRYLNQVAAGEELATLRGHKRTVSALAVSPDGRLLLSGAMEPTLRLWEAETGNPVGEMSLLAGTAGGNNGVTALEFSPDGTRLAAATAEFVRLYSWPGRTTLADLPGKYARLAFSPDNQWLAVGDGSAQQLFGTEGGKVVLWKVGTIERVREFTNVGSRVLFSPREPWLIMGSSKEGVITIWDWAKEAVAHTLSNAGPSASLAISPDGRFLARANNSESVAVWELPDGKPMPSLEGYRLGTYQLRFSPDGRWLAGAGMDQIVRRWSIGDWRLSGQWRGHDGQVFCVAFSPDGARVCSGGRDASVRIWNSTPPRTAAPFATQSSSMIYMPEGDLLAAGILNLGVRLWQVKSNAVAWDLPSERNSFAGTPDGRWLATENLFKQVSVWDVPGRKRIIGPLDPNPALGSITTMALSSDGRFLALGGLTGYAQLLELPTGRSLALWRAHPDLLHRVLFTSTGQTLLAASRDQTVSFWSAPDCRRQETLRGHQGGVLSLAFSPDESALATVSGDSSIRVWDWPTGRLAATYRAHEAGIFSVAFSPDGRTLLTGSEDRTLRFWHLATGREVAVVRTDGAVTVIGVSSAGDFFLTGESNGAIRHWASPLPNPHP